MAVGVTRLGTDAQLLMAGWPSQRQEAVTVQKCRASWRNRFLAYQSRIQTPLIIRVFFEAHSAEDVFLFIFSLTV